MKKTYKGKSGIPDGGFGLFVADKIEKDEIIDEFTGDMISHDEAQRRVDAGLEHRYFIHINSRWCMDVSNSDCLAKFANDAAGPKKVAGVRNNCHIHLRGKRVFLKASRMIKSGSEVLVPYGRAYWKDLGF